MAVFFICGYLKQENKKYIFKIIGIIVITELFLFAGFYRYGMTAEMTADMKQFCEDKQKYEISGCIKDVERRRGNGKVYVQLEKVTIANVTEYMEIAGRVQVIFEEDSGLIKIGRIIHVSGTYAAFQEQSNEGSFDSQAYYNSIGIYGIFYSKPSEISQAVKEYNIFLNSLSIFREQIQDKLYKITDETYASVLSGVLLGYKSEIDSVTKDLYQIAGISHLLAISGLHVSVIGMFIYRLLRKRFRFVISGIGAGFFVMAFGIMTGNGISTRRAMVMFLLGMLAEIVGRTYDILSSLSLAAILIILEQPMAPESATMQLSFGAIIGIILATNKVMIFLRIKSKVLQTLIISECINIVTRPIIVENYYQIALFSSLVNVLVIPLFSVVLCGTIVCIGVSFFWMKLAKYIILLPIGLLKLYEVICRFYEKIPLSSRITGKVSANRVLCYYGIICVTMLLLWLIERKNPGKKKEEEFWYVRYIKRGMITFIYLGLNLLILFGYDRVNCIKMLDVGQGDSIYIGTENGLNILIDAGSSSNSKIGEYEILPFLKANAVKNLDYLIMTHSDNDHINGMFSLLEYRYQNRPYVKCLVVPDIPEPVRDETYTELVHMAEQNGIRVLSMSAGMEIQGQDFKLICLYPSKEAALTDKNDLSLNCMISIAGVSAMFTGDLGQKGENYLLRSGMPLHSDILKVAHHGSNGSSTIEYLRNVQPETALISCSENNGYGHPGTETLNRLNATDSKIYITKDCGQISIYIRKNGVYSVESFRKYGYN